MGPHNQRLAVGLLVSGAMLLASPVVAQPSQRDTLTVGITQFPSTFHPNIESMAAKSYVLGFARCMSQESVAYYTETRSKAFGRPIAEIEVHGETRAAMFKKLEQEFDKIAGFIDQGEGPYMGGATPIFADFAILAYLLFFQAADPGGEWEEIANKWQGG